MEITIMREDYNHVYFSNGSSIYRGCGIYKHRWLIDSKERRDKAEKFLKHHPKGVYTTSWFLEALNKKDALKEYENKTGNIIARYRLF